MDRFYLLAPALILFATFCVAFVIYCGLCAVGRTPDVGVVKHNQIFGEFFARYLLWLIHPLERLLIGRVSPNAVTAVSLLMCGVTGAAVGLGHLPGAVWLYAFAGILDVVDGRLARIANQQTRAGALFDSVSDRWGELFVFAGFAWYLHDSPWLLAVFGAVGTSMMVSYTRARAEGLGVELSGGMMQRAERIVLVAGGTLIAAWYGADPDDVALANDIVGVTMLICTVASGATAIGRWVAAYRALAARASAELTAATPPATLGEPLVPANANAPALAAKSARFAAARKVAQVEN